MLRVNISFVIFLVASFLCGSTKNQFLKNDCLLQKPHLSNNNLMSQDVIGYSSVKNLFYNGTNPSHLDIMNGNLKIGRFSFSPKVEKIKINNSSTFFAILQIQTWAQPGNYMNSFDNSYESGWLTEQTTMNAELSINYNYSKSLAFKDGFPKAENVIKTISSTYSGGIELGHTIKDGIEFNGGIKVAAENQTSTSIMFGESFTTSYSYSEPSSSSGPSTDGTSSIINYSWISNFDCGYNPCRQSFENLQTIIVEVDPKFDSEYLGLTLKLSMKMKCDKDWFSGSHESSNDYWYYF